MKAYSQDFRLKIVEAQKKTQETIQLSSQPFWCKLQFCEKVAQALHRQRKRRTQTSWRRNYPKINK